MISSSDHSIPPRELTNGWRRSAHPRRDRTQRLEQIVHRDVVDVDGQKSHLPRHTGRERLCGLCRRSPTAVGRPDSTRRGSCVRWPPVGATKCVRGSLTGHSCRPSLCKALSKPDTQRNPEQRWVGLTRCRKDGRAGNVQSAHPVDLKVRVHDAAFRSLRHPSGPGLVEAGFLPHECT